jgi:hypothetical protein
VGSTSDSAQPVSVVVAAHELASRVDTVMIPDGLNILDILPRELWGCHDQALHAISEVSMASIWSRNGSPWKNLGHTPMSKLFGSGAGWTSFRDCVVSAGIWECDRSWSKGTKSMAYRDAPTWATRDLIPRKLTNCRFIEKLGGMEKERQREALMEPVHHHLLGFLRDLTVIESMTRRFTCKAHRRLKEKTKDGRRRVNRQLVAKKAIAAIQAGIFRLAPDDYGRTHSNVTNIKRAIRAALRYRGEPLSEVDVANAQPLILAQVCASLHMSRVELAWCKPLGFKVPQHSGEPGVPASHSEGASRIVERLAVPPGFLFRDCPLPDDLADFLRVCEAGAFWAALADVWQLDIDDPAAKERLKRLCFKLALFGSTRGRHSKLYRPWWAFYDRWPTVGRMLVEMKERDRGIPARLSQRIESTIMIRGVCERLMVEHPGVPAITVHDSIMTTARNVGIVRALIGEEFARFGVVPTIRSN